MGKVKYIHALDENGQLIAISNVENEGHHGRVFTCLHCGGNLVAKFSREGTARKITPHFSHKVCDCSYESYIHVLAKHLLKERFDKSDTFKISIKREVECNEVTSCPIGKVSNCKGCEYQVFELKEFYSLITEEKQFDNFRADLLLEDTTGSHQPIFFEIKYKHACTTDKIESGNLIIEIDVESEERLKTILCNDLEESEIVRFYGFNRKSKQKSDRVENYNIQHFSLFRTGKASVPELHEHIPCKQAIFPHSVFEIAFVLDYFGFPTPYDYGYVAALDEGINVRACQLCKFRKDDYENSLKPHFCIMYKRRMVGNESERYKYMHPDVTDAKTCPFFEINQQLIQEVHETMKKNPYKRLK